MFVFINHTKNMIVLTNQNAHKNISNFMCQAIRDNKWSICDTIELSDINFNKYSLRKLIENDNYICKADCAQWFYI